MMRSALPPTAGWGQGIGGRVLADSVLPPSGSSMAAQSRSLGSHGHEKIRRCQVQRDPPRWLSRPVRESGIHGEFCVPH